MSKTAKAYYQAEQTLSSSLRRLDQLKSQISREERDVEQAKAAFLKGEEAGYFAVGDGKVMILKDGAITFETLNYLPKD